MKRIISFLFIAMLAGQAWAQTTFEVDNLKYTVTDEANHFVSVAQGSTKPKGVLSIEEKVTNPNDGVEYTVTGVSNFKSCSGLTAVTIPNTVIRISSCAFQYCGGIKTLDLGSTKEIGSYAFFGCSSLLSLSLPTSLTTIEKFAFCGCTKITSVVWPQTVTTMNESVFDDCTGLKSITIPEGITSIGMRVFDDCINLTTITIPSSVTSIGFEAFDNCKSLTTITIPNSVTSIGDCAFQNCNGLTSITIPNSVTSIGGYAFYNCSGLTSVTIPNSVTSIGARVFRNCSNLTEINVGSNNTKYASQDGVLFNKDKTTIVCYPAGKTETTYIIPNSVTSIGDYAFSDCSGLTSVTIPNSVTSIGNEAFSGCSGLTSVTFPNSITSIGNNAFIRCNNLLKEYDNAIYIGDTDNPFSVLIMPKSKEITTCEINGNCIIIASHAFSGCSGLTSITIPNSVTSIGNYAFQNCNSLNTVTIGNKVTSIGNNAFSGCSGLTSITIPNSVTSIGNSAFQNCNSLTKAEFASIESLCGTSFGNSSANPLYYAHNLFINGEKVTNLAIPQTVTDIGAYAFYNCSGLTSVTIPNSVTSIGNLAFYGCNNTTLYSESSSKPSGWSSNWTNRSSSYIKWGCKVVKLAVNNATYGTATATGYSIKTSDGSMWYLNNAQVKLTASPQSGYHVMWENNTTQNTRTFSATESKTYTATFETHTEVADAAVAATCTSTGKTAGKHCSVCNAILIAQTTTSALGHNYGTPTYTWSDDGKSCSAKAVCSRNSSHTETENAAIASAVTTAATCTAKGKTTYTATFTNSRFATQTKTVTDIAALGHNYGSPTYTWSADGKSCSAKTVCSRNSSHTETENASISNTVATAATCESMGQTKYTASFSNSRFKTQTKTVTDIAALGHNYGTPTYTWSDDGKSCSAKAVCSRNSSHTETENAAIASAVTTAATCTAKGKTTYTATFTNSRFSTQTKTVTDIAALGHNYGTPTYTWSADGKSCSAKAVCSRNSSHTATENATITSAETVTPTCEEEGTTTYTATFTDSKFSMQTKSVADIHALGHDYGTPTYTWSTDGKSCSAKAVCSRNSSHTETENAAITSEVTTAATCTAKGKTTYTATFTNSRFAAQAKTVTDIAALGHSYGTPTYVWDEDGSACIATTVCQHDASHVVTQNGTITSAVTTPATCEGEGSTTYTAAFTDNKFATQTKAIVDIPALQHSYGTPTYAWTDDGSACTATTICLHDANHVVTENATITSEETIAPTCEGTGTTTYTAKFSDSKFTTQTKAVVDITAAGHKADSIEIESFVAATCTSAGSYDSVVYCSVCQAELFRENKEISANGHTYSSTVAAPTCTAVGYTTHTCSVCNHTYNSDTVSANGHKPDSVLFENIVAATCTVAGSQDSVVYCSVCKTELSRNALVIPAQGHSYSSNVVAPTCTAEGYTVNTCSVCNHTFNSDTVPAHGHTAVVDSAVAATATTEGLTEGSHCSVCGETIVAQVIIPVLGEQGGDDNQGEAGNEGENGNQGGNEGQEENEPEGGNNEGNGNESGNENQGGENDEPATAIAVDAASEVSIYAHHNIIVIENADAEIRVYNAMGALVATANETNAEIRINITGVYVVRVGNTAKRVMIID